MKVIKYLAILILFCSKIYGQVQYDVAIIGGGASGTMAAIQSAREGLSVCIIEEGPWLGGMLTSAGVSAIDGNHKIAGGLWQEFRQELYNHYGGPEQVETGWVSNTLFEPHVGDSILKAMVKKEGKITTFLNSTTLLPISKVNQQWRIAFISRNKNIKEIYAKIVIDATELGDVYASLSNSYDIGMESSKSYKESFTPKKANNIVQDLTYVIILKDYGKDVDKTIEKPNGYNKEDFICACDTADPSTKQGPLIDCSKMMTYGKLPNNKYMINWPNCGNDYYINIIANKLNERIDELEKVKQHSLRFLYFLQTELGNKNLGLADDEFPTSDQLPMIPYHRESRRIRGEARLLIDHLISPFEQKEAFYRTGIAVGDYPVDHHHKKNSKAPNIDFINIKIGAYNLPAGALIPKDLDNFIVAEKSISVSNIVNGTTRLQPVVLGIGQAAGALAAESILSKKSLKDISIRNVQQRLLKSKAYIMPYIDVGNNDIDFEVIQKIGATGILKGRAVPYKWANQTWFYPENLVTEYELIEGLRPYEKSLNTNWKYSGDYITSVKFIEILKDLSINVNFESISHLIKVQSLDSKLTRRDVCKLLNEYYKPFEKEVDFNGKLKE